MTDHDRINTEAAARLMAYVAEIEALPARPEPGITSHVTDSTMRTLVIASFSERQMDEYGLACYRAALASRTAANAVRAGAPLLNGGKRSEFSDDTMQVQNGVDYWMAFAVKLDADWSDGNPPQRPGKFPDAADPTGHAPDRPADLVPLANGRSVDLGGRWPMPK